MKRKGPSYGQLFVEYRLENVFRRAVKDFQEADAAREKAEKEYQMGGKCDGVSFLNFISAQERRMETGVILLMSSGALLEQTINDYALTFLDANSYEQHLDNLRTVTKWILLPRICQQKEIAEDHPAINALHELVKARNAIVHHKRRELDVHTMKAGIKVSPESARFLSACRKAEPTVEALIEILTSPPPGAKKK